jgi:hypothetical protein
MSEQPSRETRADFWRAQIDSWQASGQSQLAYCEANALNYPQFVYWRRKFRQPTLAERSGSRQAFVPVIAATPVTHEGLAVMLPNGVELRGIHAHNVAVASQLLRCLS